MTCANHDDSTEHTPTTDDDPFTKEYALIFTYEADYNPTTAMLFALTSFDIPEDDEDVLEWAFNDNWRTDHPDITRDSWEYADVVRCRGTVKFGWDDLTLTTSDDETILDRPTDRFPTDPNNTDEYVVLDEYYQDLHDPHHLINTVSAESPKDAAILATATAPRAGDGWFPGHEVGVWKVTNRQQFSLADPVFDDVFTTAGNE